MGDRQGPARVTVSPPAGGGPEASRGGAKAYPRVAKGNGKITQTALASDLGVKAPDFSAIKLLALGQEVPRNPSRESVERLAKRFGIEMPK